MAKFLKNESLGVICIGDKNIIPGTDAVEVTNKEAESKMVQAYIKAGKLSVSDVQKVADIDEMSATQLKAYAAEKGIDVGSAKAKADILAVIKTAETGE